MVDQFKSSLVSSMLSEAPASVLIHSDITRGLPVETDRGDRHTFIEKHCELISELFPGSKIYMPAFNYDFLTSRSFDVAKSPSQVGVLSEHFRQYRAAWRTSDPVFSFSGTGEFSYQDPLNPAATIDPFGPESFFDFLYREDCFLFHYGSRFECSTVLHYAERMSGVLKYRYDKLFYGNVINKAVSRPVLYKYHVKPRSGEFRYDYEKMIKGLTDAEILTSFELGRIRISYCNLRKLVDYLIENMRQDPYSLLHPVSIQWLQPMIEQLGRGLRLTDFEEVDGLAFES